MMPLLLWQQMVGVPLLPQVPLLLATLPIETPTSVWYLPFHSEPLSHSSFTPAHPAQALTVWCC